MTHRNYDLVLIRHAQSTFNQATFRQSKNLSITHCTWQQLIQNTQFNKRVTYCNLLTDSLLSQEGLSQCQHYKNQCSLINPNLILVSPYRRALQTCRLLFKNNITTKIIVEPILAQVFRFSCDVPVQLQENKKKYSNFDFAKIQHLGNDWYQSNLSSQLTLKIKQKIKQKNIKSHEDKKNLLLSMLSSQQIHQNAKMLRTRASLIKQLLSTYKKQYPVIVVISHYYIIEYLMAKQFDNTHENTNKIYPINCYPYYNKLSQLQKFS